MTIKERLQKDLNDALKTGNQLRRLVLGMVITAIKNKEVGKRTQLSKKNPNVAELEEQSQLSNDETIETVMAEVKKRKEAIEQFRAGGREELAQKEKTEMDILNDYLPKQASVEEVRNEVKQIIADSGAKELKDMGRVIGLAMTKLKGRTDGGTVSRIAKEELAG